MRVVHPKELAASQAARTKRARSRRMVRRAILVLVFGSLIGWWLLPSKETTTEPTSASATSQQTMTSQSALKEESSVGFREFDAESFKNLYNSFSYPNTDQQQVPPQITGNEAADERIRSIAESRGYRLRSLARGGLAEIDQGLRIQPLAAAPLKALLDQAAAAGLSMHVTAAYRSVDEQRELFISRLEGVELWRIAEGQADDLIVGVLGQVAPPGYSRHHSGFTVDLQCGSLGLYSFEDSDCYAWMASDNFLLLKQLGWVPSYPKGADLQGPEPEPWEYIWVGSDALR